MEIAGQAERASRDLAPRSAALDARPIALRELARQHHAGMQHDVRDRLGGIVPAEIFEIDEGEAAVGTAQRIVKAEIRGAEHPQVARERRCDGDPRRRAGGRQPLGRAATVRPAPGARPRSRPPRSRARSPGAAARACRRAARAPSRARSRPRRRRGALWRRRGRAMSAGGRRNPPGRRRRRRRSGRVARRRSSRRRRSARRCRRRSAAVPRRRRPMQEGERRIFLRQSVARVLGLQRIELERRALVGSGQQVDPIVAAAPHRRGREHVPAEEGRADAGDLVVGGEGVDHRSTASAMSRQCANASGRAPRGGAPLVNRILTMPGGNSGSSRTSGRSSMKCVNSSRAELLDLARRASSRRPRSRPRTPSRAPSKKPLLLHPAERGLAQIEPRLVEMPVFGLVAHDQDLVPGGARASQEIRGAREHHCRRDALPVHRALQALPLRLAAGQGADRMAHRLLAAVEIRRRPARVRMRACGTPRRSRSRCCRSRSRYACCLASRQAHRSAFARSRRRGRRSAAEG